MNKRKKATTKNSAFTLIELLVVMAIIGILAAVGLVSFRTSQARSRDAERKSDLKQIASSLELYYADYAKYPGAMVWGSEFTDGKTVYFKKLPNDPASGLTYVYRNPDSPSNQKFQLYAHLENSEDINCLPDTNGNKSCIAPDVPAGVTCGAVCNFAITSPNTAPSE